MSGIAKIHGYNTQIRISDLPEELRDYANSIDGSSIGEDKNDGYLKTFKEITLFHEFCTTSLEGYQNKTPEEMLKDFGMSETNTFKSWMDPVSWLINQCISNNDNNNKFISYLNPLITYSETEDPEINKQKWVDPLLTTADANIEGSHFKRLNPILASMSNELSKEEKIYSWADPGMSAATSFIKDKKTRDTVGWILNPIGKGISKLFS